MLGSIAPVATSGLSRQAGARTVALRYLRGALEGIVLLLVCAAPWPYGSVQPGFELLLYAGLAVLLLLWAAHVLLAGQLDWQACSVSVCLALLFLVGLWQLAPLPRASLDWLAPGTAHLYEQLLPSSPEELPFAEERSSPPFDPGTTITLSPGATRPAGIRWLAVFLLFLVVRQTLASPATLRRLSIAVVCNGALLALFALIQFWTSQPNTVYWTHPSKGAVFGPFINRNHFAFYENLCLGLGLGLLLSRHPGTAQALFRPAGGRPSAPRGSVVSRPRHGTDGEGGWSRGLLQDIPALWIALALALMLSSVAVCLSRGGVCAFVSAALLCLLLWRKRADRGRLASSLALVLVPALALALWFGLERLGARLETTWAEEDLARNSRINTWLQVLPLSGDFPLWGTGYGTFRYVEPLQRTNAAEQGLVWDHAHNEYVEALVEGGLLRLLLSVGAIALVFSYGLRAVRRPVTPAAAGLALGALFGFSTLVIHSFVEFGLHIPAIALLTVVLCAHLCVLGSGPAEQPTERPGLRLWGLAPPLAAVTAVVLGLILVAEGWKAYRADRLAFVAQHGQFASAEDRLARLEAAVRLVPEQGQRHLDVAQAQLQEYRKQGGQVVQRIALQGVAGAVLALSPPALPTSTVQPALLYLPVGLAPAAVADEQLRALDRKHLLPALWHFQQARNTCPLLPGAHLELAAHAERLRLGNTRGAYLDRVKLLSPADPHIWYQCGLFELAWLQPGLAWKDWRRSLELSDEHLSRILELSAKVLTPTEILERIVPDKPELLVQAAAYLYTGPEGIPQQRPTLEKALHLYGQRSAPPSPADLHTLGVIHAGLDQPHEALKVYRRALDLEPRRADWRYEYAELLHRQGQLQDARRELSTLLQQQPGHTSAKELLNTVTYDIAKGR